MNYLHLKKHLKKLLEAAMNKLTFEQFVHGMIAILILVGAVNLFVFGNIIGG